MPTSRKDFWVLPQHCWVLTSNPKRFNNFFNRNKPLKIHQINIMSKLIIYWIWHCRHYRKLSEELKTKRKQGNAFVTESLEYMFKSTIFSTSVNSKIQIYLTLIFVQETHNKFQLFLFQLTGYFKLFTVTNERNSHEENVDNIVFFVESMYWKCSYVVFFFIYSRYMTRFEENPSQIFWLRLGRCMKTAS